MLVLINIIALVTLLKKKKSFQINSNFSQMSFAWLLHYSKQDFNQYIYSIFMIKKNKLYLLVAV